MTTVLDNIEQRAALAIAMRFFKLSTFMPRVGNSVPCYAYLARDQELQPVGYGSVADIKKEVVVYLKSEISDDLMEPEAYFTIDSKKYTVEAPAENDGNILGRVVIRDEN